MRTWPKQKIFGFFIGTLLFSVTVLLFSYANYVWRSSDTGVSFNISDEYFYCESGLEFEKQGLSPVLDYRKGDYWKFKVNNIGRADTKFSLSLNITSIDTPLLSESFKYKLVVDKTGGSNQCNNTSSSGCVEVTNGSGNFKSMKVGMNTLVESIDLPNNTRYEYYLFLYIDGNMPNDPNMQNSVISATLDVCEIVVFLDYNGGNVQQKFLKATDTYEGLPDKPTKNPATIIYNTDGGSNVVNGVINHTFAGWYLENTYQNLIKATSPVKTTVNHTLYAKWTDDVIPLPNTTKEGHTFLGWYSDSAKTKFVGKPGDNYSTTSTSSIPLYAKWTPIRYTLTVKPNGGTWGGKTTDSTITQDYGTTLAIPVPNPLASYTIMYDGNNGTTPSAMKAYRKFKPWSLGGAGKGKITTTAPIETMTQTYTYGAGNDTLSANYEDIGNSIKLPTTIRSYTITYDKNNTGATTNKDSDTINYILKGWYKAATGGEVVGMPGENYSPTASTTLYAQWTSVSTTLPTITKLGNDCWWNTEKNGTGTTYNQGQTYTPTIGIVLYAICQPHSYNIVYNLNNGTKGSSAPEKVNYGSEVNISYPTKEVIATGNANGTGAIVGAATSKAQTFAGWTASNLDTTTAQYGTISGAVTTKWDNGATKVKGPYFKNLTPLDGATVTMTANWTPVKFNLPTISKPGYTCKWNTAADGSGTSYASGDSYTPDPNSKTNISFYVTDCTPNTYMVTLKSGNLAFGFADVSNISESRASYSVSNKVVTVTSKTNDGYIMTNGRVFLSAGQTYTFSCDTNGIWGQSETTDTVEVYLMLNGEYNTYYGMVSNNNHSFTPTVSGVYWLRFDVNAAGKTYNFSNIKFMSTIESRQVKYDSTYGSLPFITHPGLTFNGWYTADVGGSEIKSDTIVKTPSDHTIYGQWNLSSLEHTLSYNGNKFSTSKNISSGGLTITYDQSTSYLTINGTQTAEAIKLMEFTGDKFTLGDQYRITLTYISGNVSSTVADSYNALATEIKKSDGSAISTRNFADVRFKNENMTGTLTINSAGATEGNMLYCWLYTSSTGALTFSNYKIKVNITKVESDKKITYGSVYGSMPVSPTRYGHTFAGWYTAESGGQKVTSDSVWSIVGDQTIYAHWTPNTYKVTLDNQGATTAGTTAYYYQYNTTKVVNGVTAYYYTDSALTSPLTDGQTISVPTKTGYTFGGYYTGTNGSEFQYVNSSGVTINNLYQKVGNITLYAKWTPKTYTTTFKSGNLVYGFSNVSNQVDGENLATYSVSNKTVTVTAKRNDGYVRTNGRVYLEANKTYYFSCDTNGTWGATSGTDTVEAFIMLDGVWGNVYRMAEKDNYKFTTTVSGVYWIRLDVNTTGKTYNFSNIRITSDFTTKTVTYNSNYGTLPTITHNGLTFNGWYTAESGGTKIIDTTKVTTASNHTLYAQWTANYHNFSLDFKIDGTTYDSAASYGGGSRVYACIKIDDMDKGCLSDHDVQYLYGTKWEVYALKLDGVVLTKDHGKGVMTGDVARIPWVWSLNATMSGNGTVSPTSLLMPTATQYTTNGATLTLSNDGRQMKATPTDATGYTTTFSGWSPTNGTVSAKSTVTANFTRTAKNYTVSYVTGGGSACSAKTVTYNSTYGTLCTTSRAGYTFAGWFNSAGTQVTSTTKVTTASNHTLTARWTANKYNATYITGGGSACNPTYKTVTFGSAYGTLCTTSKTGYNFSGWYTDAGSQVTTSTIVAIASNHNLNARWSGISYTLTYNSNGGNACNPATKSVTFGSGYGALCTPTRTGYTFAGWFTASSGGSQVTSSTTVSTAGAHTIYAHWNANSYTVTYDNNGGKGCTTVSAKYDSNYPALCVPSLDGNVFLGWFTAKTGGTQVTTSTKVTTAGAHTIYAHWKDCHKITLNANGGSTTGSYSTVYQRYGVGWYSDAQCTNPVSHTSLQAKRTDHRFRGYYSSTGASGYKVMGQTSGFISNKFAWNDTTIYAIWSDIPIITSVKYLTNSGGYKNFGQDAKGNYLYSDYTFEYVWRVLFHSAEITSTRFCANLDNMRTMWGWVSINEQEKYTNTSGYNQNVTNLNPYTAIRMYDTYRTQIVRKTAAKPIYFRARNYSTGTLGYALGNEFGHNGGEDGIGIGLDAAGLTKFGTADPLYCSWLENIG